MKTLKQLSLILLTAIVFTACSNDDDAVNPEPVNEEEVITTLTATLTPVGGGTTVTLKTQDLDGDGPNAPVITVSSPLTISTVYNASLVLENETESPAELINEEIETEDDEHQFFYQATNDIATFTYQDFDGNGNPLGLEFTLTTAATAGSGTITITLRHEPVKDASGVSDGDITNAGGETDIQAVFPVTLQ
ncbi:type 1 periplasmic binding fold superfamily protein [Olleya sp. YS]|uniref:type 1 periplasmic binding fold superfamily protein n=1 Tax=Olleya sp. YS TaxID=3028318 RepID=UPI002434589C|nr:type 1 periplasmic binding fold superfamily protein [Olleya sp. YS]WGD34617.1 type 1 periplasmic binding fold superfamily protein [Olleya sp. YS]